MFTRIFAAAVFALLTVTGPARAATIEWQLTNVVAATNPAITLTRFFDYDTVLNPDGNSPNYKITLFQNSLPYQTCLPHAGGAMDFESINSVVGGSGPPISNFLLVGTHPFDGTGGPVIPLDSTSTFWFIAPFGFPITGSLTEVSNTDVSPVPLPAALPLFGSGVVALAGFAWKKRGKVS